MEYVKIRFKVNEIEIKRTITIPESSHNVIFDLFNEFEDFNELNFFYNNAWVYGAIYDYLTNKK